MNYGFMIASTGSGCGKTTITCALLELLKRHYDKVCSFKCGPDYIDPMFHREILGVNAGNLDLFFSDEEQVREFFYRGNESEIGVVEGVMGLYDGLSPESDEASSYRLACALDIPVILVVDAKGMGRSMLAVIRGFLDMDDEHRIKGVILNRMHKSYASKLAPVIEKELGVKVLGSMPVTENVLESRHLGLKLPHEKRDLERMMIENSHILEDNLELEKLLSFCEIKNVPALKTDIHELRGHEEIITEPPTETSAIPAANLITEPAEAVSRIAVAKDEAFCFIYEENIRLLEKYGAKIVYFSPLKDHNLPEGTKGLILYGGYPELYADKLSENEALLADIRQALQGGMPVLAECGGFMYLHEAIVTKEGREYPMAGFVKGRCRYTGHLVRFGYAAYKDEGHIFLPEGNDVIKGHEFHYYDSDAPGNGLKATKPGGKTFAAGYVSPSCVMGYQHLYYPSNPEFAIRFLNSVKLA